MAKEKTAEERALAVAQIHETVRQNEIDALKAMIEHADQDWRQSWSNDGMAQQSGNTKKPYRNVNQIILTANTLYNGHKDPRWMTANQVKQKGYSLKPDAKFTMISFISNTAQVDKKDEKGNVVLGENGKPEKITVRLKKPILRYYYVTNGSNVEGLPAFVPPSYTPEQLSEKEKVAFARAEQIINETVKDLGVDFKEVAYTRAFFRPEISMDGTYAKGGKLIVPMREQFTSTAAYYATAFHELAHSTLTKEGSRTIDEQNEGLMLFGDRGYAREELIAELTSLFLCQELGIDTSQSELNKQSWGYIRNWSMLLTDDDLGIALNDSKKLTSTLLRYAPELTFEKALELEKVKEHEQQIDDKVAEVLEAQDNILDTRSELEKLWNMTDDISYIPILDTRSSLENVKENERHLKVIESKLSEQFEVTISQVADKSLFLVSRKAVDGSTANFVATNDREKANAFLADPDMMPDVEQPVLRTEDLVSLTQSLRMTAEHLRSDDFVFNLDYLNGVRQTLSQVEHFKTEVNRDELDDSIVEVMDNLDVLKDDLDSILETQPPKNLDETLELQQELFALADSFDETAESIYQLGITDKALSPQAYLAKYQHTGLPNTFTEQEFPEVEGAKQYNLMPDRVSGQGAKTVYKVGDDWFNSPSEIHKSEVKVEVKPTFAERLFNEVLKQGTFDPQRNAMVHQSNNARARFNPEGRLFIGKDALGIATRLLMDKNESGAGVHHVIPESGRYNYRYHDVTRQFNSKFDSCIILPDNSLIGRKGTDYHLFTLSEAQMEQMVGQPLSAVLKDESWMKNAYEHENISLFDFVDMLDSGTPNGDFGLTFEDTEYVYPEKKQGVFEQLAQLETTVYPTAALNDLYTQAEIDKAIEDDLTLAEKNQGTSKPLEYVHYNPENPALLFEDKSILMPDGSTLFNPSLVHEEMRCQEEVNRHKTPLNIAQAKCRLVLRLSEKDPTNEMHKKHLQDIGKSIVDAYVATPEAQLVGYNLVLNSREDSELDMFQVLLVAAQRKTKDELFVEPTLAEKALLVTKGLNLKGGSLASKPTVDVLTINEQKDPRVKLVYQSENNVVDVTDYALGASEYGRPYLFADKSMLLVKENEYAVLPRDSKLGKRFEQAKTFRQQVDLHKENLSDLNYKPLGMLSAIKQEYAVEADFPPEALSYEKQQAEKTAQIEVAQQEVNNLSKRSEQTIERQPMKGCYIADQKGNVLALGKTDDQVKSVLAQRENSSDVAEFIESKGLRVLPIENLDLHKVYATEDFLLKVSQYAMKKVVEAEQSITRRVNNVTAAEAIAYLTKNGMYDPIRKQEGNYHPLGRDLQQILNIYGYTHKEPPKQVKPHPSQVEFDSRTYQFDDCSILEYLPDAGLAAYRNDDQYRAELTSMVQKNVLTNLRDEYRRVMEVNNQPAPNTPRMR